MDSFQINERGVEKAGRAFTKGAVGYLSVFLLVGLVIFAAMHWWAGTFDYDDTDPPNGRSGMALRTDHGTGCQYLETAKGGITPRLGSDGKQVCR